MKKIILILATMSSFGMIAQKTMFIHKDNIALGVPIKSTDSLYFSTDQKTMYFESRDTQKIIFSHLVSAIDSITFSTNTDTVYVNYNGSTANIINPYAYTGVEVQLTNAGVKIVSSNSEKDIVYSLDGTSTNGFFKIYTEKKFHVLLNGLTLTNSSGPAINVQSKKKMFLHVVPGESNTLSDGTTYATAPLNSSNLEEDQKGTIFSEGQFDILESGTLNIKSLAKSAIVSDENIEMYDATIKITQAVKNGFKTQEGITFNSGNATIVSSDNSIDGETEFVRIIGGQLNITTSSADVKAITADSLVAIEGGTISITMGGNNSIAIDSKEKVVINNGNITVRNSGGVILTASGSGNDVSYSSAISSDSLIIINGGTLNLTQNGIAGRGVVSDVSTTINGGDITITNSGNGAVYVDKTGVSDTYHSCALKAKGDLTLNNGKITLSSTGTAGTGISVAGNLTVGTTSLSPIIGITTTGAKITIAASSGSGPNASGGNYDQSKAISSNANIVINNGSITISSIDDGIKSEISTTLNGGNIKISTAIEGIESPLITVNGGTIDVTATNDGFNGTKGTVSGGTESNDGSYIYFKGGYVLVSVASGDALDANGNIVMTGGTVIAVGPSSGVEEAVDFNGSLSINGGTFLGVGSNSSMNKAMSTASTQKGIFATTSSAVASNTFFRLQDANGTNMVSYLCSKAQYSFLFSSPSLANGSYNIYTGGTITGGTNKDGVVTGGTYSSGTLKKTFTISSNVSTVTF